VVAKLRQIEVLTAGGKSIPQVCKEGRDHRCHVLPLAQRVRWIEGQPGQEA
jgi:hypothetical protein